MKNNKHKRLPNYAPKLLQAASQPPKGVYFADIYHDDWCAIFRGQPCNCEPELRYCAYRPLDPARN
jgi:hypothetical protein